MTLFIHNRNTNILLAIQYVRVLMDNDTRMQTVFVRVVDREFWGVSHVFHKVLNRSKDMPFDQALEYEIHRTRNLNIKRLLEILNVGKDIDTQLDELFHDILNMKRDTKQGTIDAISRGLSRMMTLISFPVIIFFILMAETPVSNMGLDISPYFQFLPILLVIDVFLLFAVLVMMEVRE